MKQPKILVTGATGKTGSAVADRLLAEDVSGTPMFVLPLLRENKTPGCSIQRVLENDFVVVTGAGTARDFLRLLTGELH